MKFVFVCPDMDFLRIQYADFESGRTENETEFIKIGGLQRKLAKALNLYGVYRYKIFDFLLNGNLTKSFSKLDSNDDTEYCFIIYSRSYEDYRTALTRYIRNRYKHCRILVYYGDMVSSHRCTLEEVKEDVDNVFTFDENDARKYSLKWLLEPFSKSTARTKDFCEENNPNKWDFTFVGRAKNRYEKIIEIYEKLTAAGYTCDFHITGVESRMQKYNESISYEALDFTSLLKHVVASKCIIEVMQEGGESPTTRYTEAMLLGRNLLTNCKTFANSIDTPENVFYFSNIDDINDALIEQLVKQKNFDRTKYIEIFSIETMIKSITEQIGL